MRIWSLHPKYLDSKGLVALWRETLLAKNVLRANTKGYKNHPQLNRFKNTEKPIDAINHYLSTIYYEAEARGYKFDKEKIDWNFVPIKLNVTLGQINYESAHLSKKLYVRNLDKYNTLLSEKTIVSNPIFIIIEGEIENWEIIQ